MSRVWPFWPQSLEILEVENVFCGQFKESCNVNYHSQEGPSQPFAVPDVWLQDCLQSSGSSLLVEHNLGPLAQNNNSPIKSARRILI